MALVYPHRVTFLNRGKCDVCGNKGQELVNTNTDRFFGWETCTDEKCNQTIREWYRKTMIPLEELREKFGDWVYVHRSTGKKESGWNIVSDAHQEEEGGPYWIRVRHYKHHLTKDLPLSDLQRWNEG